MELSITMYEMSERNMYVLKSVQAKFISYPENIPRHPRRWESEEGGGSHISPVERLVSSMVILLSSFATLFSTSETLVPLLVTLAWTFPRQILLRETGDRGRADLEGAVPLVALELIVRRGDGGGERAEQVHPRLIRVPDVRSPPAQIGR